MDNVNNIIILKHALHQHLKHRDDWNVLIQSCSIYARFRIVNLRNWTKSDNLGILKQLYYLIYQCLERLKLLELSNNQGLQKFTISELRPFLHTKNVKKSEEYRPFLIAME